MGKRWEALVLKERKLTEGKTEKWWERMEGGKRRGKEEEIHWFLVTKERVEEDRRELLLRGKGVEMMPWEGGGRNNESVVNSEGKAMEGCWNGLYGHGRGSISVPLKWDGRKRS